MFTPIPLKHGALDILGWRITETGTREGTATGTRRMFITHISHSSSHREIEEICQQFGEKRKLEGAALGTGWSSVSRTLYLLVNKAAFKTADAYLQRNGRALNFRLELL
jgi:hypothetical protein